MSSIPIRIRLTPPPGFRLSIGPIILMISTHEIDLLKALSTHVASRVEIESTTSGRLVLIASPQTVRLHR